MSAPGRPKREDRSAQHEGRPVSAPGRPKREDRSAQHEGRPVNEGRLPLRRSAAVVGVGHSDWRGDWDRVRAGETPYDAYGYAAVAFRHALADANITRAEIDGLIGGHTTAYERMGEVLGLDVRWGGQADAVGAILQAVMAIETGLAEVVALVYGNNQRSAKVQYGGSQAMGGESFLSYVYHAPWGLTSQGALYAMTQRRFAQERGYAERDLGEIAVAQRAWAARNPNAILRKPVTIEDYLASPYVVEPLHLLDYCLVNDGGVALILAEAGRAARICEHPVYIEAVGRQDLNRGATSLQPRLEEFYAPAQREVARQIFGATGYGPEDVSIVQVYDSFSVHVLLALEGYGYCRPGEAARLFREQGIGPGGRLPVNTSGGHLSESYMQGWNHQVEAVRQLRGSCGERQVDDCRLVHYSSDIAGKAISILYSR
jgi:acetyl-CoA acetyltransferase